MNFLTAMQMTMIQNIGQQGQNSQVIQVHDPQLNTQLAVKIIAKANFTNPQTYFDEARMLHDSKHTNVVDVKFASFDNDNIFIAMPFYSKGSLKTLMDQRHLTIREVIKFAFDFLSGLHHIHTKGLLHFDLKPSNILIDDTGKGLVTDFGLAKYTNNLGLANQTLFYGKHVVPESLNVADRTALSDIFQAGMTLYRMCNGETSFDLECSVYDFTTLPGVQKVVADINGGKFPKKDYLPHIPRGLRMIINKAVQGDPDKRHPSTIDLLNELANVSGNLDWVYETAPGRYKWSRERESGIEMIEILEVTSGYEVKVTKFRNSTAKTTNDNKNSLKNIESLKKAMAHVEKVLKDLD